MSLFPFFQKKKCHTAQCAKSRLHASVRSPGTDIVSSIKTTVLEALAQYTCVQENKITFSNDKKRSALTITVPIQDA
ncbi:MAG: hypothetical protein VXW87_02800 [Pseudomonadota bacterium]|nr:hypothetical protein [Pseudomonadota bacterium]